MIIYEWTEIAHVEESVLNTGGLGRATRPRAERTFGNQTRSVAAMLLVLFHF
jgi:hypothetical protein